MNEVKQMYVKYQSSHTLSFRFGVGRDCLRLGKQARQYRPSCNSAPRPQENRTGRNVRGSMVISRVESGCEVWDGMFLDENISIFSPQHNLPSQTAVPMDAMCLMTWKEK